MRAKNVDEIDTCWNLLEVKPSPEDIRQQPDDDDDDFVPVSVTGWLAKQIRSPNEGKM
jgi:hypothetical protein